jgi:ribosomal protein S18 acetylase RimI-like enzyme
MITIKAASSADIPTIQAIANITWPITFAPLMSEKKLVYMMEMMYSTKALTHQMEEENHDYLLAYNGEKPVGYCSYELDYRGDAQLMMHKLYLLPSAQGMGLGRSFIAHLNAIATKHKQHSLRLQVLPANKEAMSIYERLNFKKVGEEPKILNDEMGSFTDNVMCRDL